MPGVSVVLPVYIFYGLIADLELNDQSEQAEGVRVLARVAGLTIDEKEISLLKREAQELPERVVGVMN